MKLEEGMYVRTKYLDDEGYLLEPVIAKIQDMTKYSIYLDDFGDCKEEHILKASHNIIDLIETGDYVNESRVVYFMIDEEKSIKQGIDEKIGVVVEEKWETTKYLTKDIKSIVTKEQFESMSYKVGD